MLTFDFVSNTIYDLLGWYQKTAKMLFELSESIIYLYQACGFEKMLINNIRVYLITLNAIEIKVRTRISSFNTLAFFIFSMNVKSIFFTSFKLFTAALAYTGCPKKKWPNFTMSYLQRYWIWRLQIFYINSTWVEIVHWKILCDHLNPFKLRRYLKNSKFSAL